MEVCKLEKNGCLKGICYASHLHHSILHKLMINTRAEDRTGFGDKKRIVCFQPSCFAYYIVVESRRRLTDTFFFVSSGFRKAQTSRQLSHATGGPYFFSECTHLQHTRTTSYKRIHVSGIISKGAYLEHFLPLNADCRLHMEQNDGCEISKTNNYVCGFTHKLLKISIY